MRMYFTCKTNNRVPYVNTAIFQTTKGEVIVDRDETDYTYDAATGIMEMEWCGCYIWNPDDAEHEMNYVFPENFEDSVIALKELEIEDDAPEGYYCIPVECGAGIDFPVMQAEQ